MGDVDDIDVYVAEPIYKWQQTDQGQWAMSHAQNLRYYTSPDPTTFGHSITIAGELPEGPLLTEYLLKWSREEYL